MYRPLMILAVTALILAVPAVSAVSQTWHLLDVTYTGTKAIDGTNHHKDFFMNKTGNATGSYMNLPNISEKTTWWYAEYPVQFDDVTFGEDNWCVNINHTKKSGYTIFANVCKVNDSTGEVTYLANGSVQASSSGVDTIICYDNPNTNQIFNTGERLALRIYHNRTSTLRIYYYNITKAYYSSLKSPASDPGYPSPPVPPGVPTVNSSDSLGNKKDTFYVGDEVYVYGSGYTPNTHYNISVVNDTTWFDGKPIPVRVSGTATTVTVNETGFIVNSSLNPASSPALIWSYAEIGKYDIVVDVNGNGTYDAGIDALDDIDVNGAGFETIPEFTTIAIPIAIVLGLIFLFHRKKQKC